MAMASEERALREALEQAQHENKQLRSYVAELTAFRPEELSARIHQLEAENAQLVQRLDRADRVRAQWDAKLQGLRRELEIARTEQERLRRLLENERLAHGR